MYLFLCIVWKENRRKSGKYYMKNLKNIDLFTNIETLKPRTFHLTVITHMNIQKMTKYKILKKTNHDEFSPKKLYMNNPYTKTIKRTSSTL